jgi:ketosteroid isomerase-like protein
MRISNNENPTRRLQSLTLLCVSLLLASSNPLSHAQKSNLEQTRILALENAWNQAVRAKDATALKLLLAPQLVYVDYDGREMNKDQYLASVQAEGLQPARVVSESMSVQLYGGVAMVHGVYRENGTKGGKPYTLRERFTDSWIFRFGSWTCVSSHSTSIEQP